MNSDEAGNESIPDPTKHNHSFSKPSLRVYTLLALILAGESIFFLPFVIARIFRPTLLAVFNITNTQLGAFFSMYGIVAMASYFFRRSVS